MRTVHRFAMASDMITADMVDSAEYPFLAVKYNVTGVPHTVVNETGAVVGAVPDMEFAGEIIKALKKL